MSLMSRACCIALACTQMALAQSPEKPAMQPLSSQGNFSGFYVGLNAGYGASQRVISGQFAHFEGLLGGIFGGWGYQFSNNMYLGLEGAYTLDSRKAEQHIPGNAYRRISSKNHWEGVVRVGHVFGNTMPYLVAGCRLTQGKAFWKILNSGSPNYGKEHIGKLNFFGFVGGVGVDHKVLPNLSVGGRYTYANLVDEPFDRKIRLTDHQAVLRITYHF